MRMCWCGAFPLLPWNVAYGQCPECGTLVDLLEPEESAPVEQASLYSQAYWLETMAESYQSLGCNTLEDIILLHYRERAAHWMQYFVRHILPPANVVEIGCGMGSFTQWLGALGYQASATELDPSWRNIVHQMLGITISGDNLSTDNALANRFDAVALLDVLEHIRNPVAFFAALANELRDEGVVMIQMPEFRGITHRAMERGKDSFLRYLLPREHIHLFSRKGLTLMLDRFGFSHRIFYPSLSPDDVFLIASRSPLTFHSDQEIIKTFMKPHSIAAFAALKNFQALKACDLRAGRNPCSRVKRAIMTALRYLTRR